MGVYPGLRQKPAGSGNTAAALIVLTIIAAISIVLYFGSIRARHAKGMDSAMCEVAARTQVCAHRATVDELTQLKGRKTMSWEERLKALAGAGVVCADVDVVASKDGHLLVGHPSELQAFLQKTSGSKRTLPPAAELSMREMAALVGGRSKLDAAFPPLLFTVLPTFAALKDKTNSLLFLELKGRALSRHHLASLNEAATRHAVARRIAVWFPSTSPTAVTDMRLALDLKRAAPHAVKTARAFLDSVPAPSNKGGSARMPVQSHLTPEDRATFDLVGPSINARPESLFTEVAAARLPLVLWNVDNERQLERALRLGASHIISNRPFRMRELLRTRTRACGRPSHAA